MVDMALPQVTEVREVAAVTGENSANRTGSRFGVYGTDLGILWDNGNGEILAAFGDSYGRGWGGNGAGPPEADWRCNVLAGSTATDLSGGLPLHPVVTRPDGTLDEVLSRDGEIDHEATVIPTAGIAVDGTNYLHYMSVHSWGEPGHWRTNYGGIAVSDDHGRTWRKPVAARWPNREKRAGLLGRRREHPFQMGAFASAGGHVHLLGTPHGRFGSASLARVAPDRVSTVEDYEYWTGDGWVTGDPFAATPGTARPGRRAFLAVQRILRCVAGHALGRGPRRHRAARRAGADRTVERTARRGVRHRLSRAVRRIPASVDHGRAGPVFPDVPMGSVQRHPGAGEADRSRSSRRSNFPVTVLGSSSRISTWRGYL